MTPLQTCADAFIHPALHLGLYLLVRVRALHVIFTNTQIFY